MAKEKKHSIHSGIFDCGSHEWILTPPEVAGSSNMWKFELDVCGSLNVKLEDWFGKRQMLDLARFIAKFNGFRLVKDPPKP